MNQDLRAKIDAIDNDIIEKFAERMRVAGEIAKYKKENNLPILDPKRERQVLNKVKEKAPEEFSEYTGLLYSLMFELSRSYQGRVIGRTTGLSNMIKNAIENTPEILPKNVVVACQGTDGSYSSLAADRLIPNANIMFFETFDAVFSAIEKGLCKYGVIPVENSTAGSVNSVYDLMMQHQFSIVKSIRVKVDHNLLAKPGTKLSDIKEIYSHEQAISQSAGFLKSLNGVNVIPCQNTAIAAKKVAESDRPGVAAIASRACLKYYGLECVQESIQTQGNNHTRFIVISKDLEIFPGADRTSLMAVLPHEAGSLYKLLARLYALGINLNKLESRPLPDRDFEFMFYLDLDTPVYSEEFMQLMDELDNLCERFHYLGSYGEII